mmetsp:Transcript_32565/g.52901  ORF Transcript_32565/g.52901 Transcript_32565/m.52901 type:complete len:253 (-) Transcript_32565:392-1150(-)
MKSSCDRKCPTIFVDLHFSPFNILCLPLASPTGFHCKFIELCITIVPIMYAANRHAEVRGLFTILFHENLGLTFLMSELDVVFPCKLYSLLPLEFIIIEAHSQQYLFLLCLSLEHLRTSAAIGEFVRTVEEIRFASIFWLPMCIVWLRRWIAFSLGDSELIKINSKCVRTFILSIEIEGRFHSLLRDEKPVPLGMSLWCKAVVELLGVLFVFYGIIIDDGCIGAEFRNNGTHMLTGKCQALRCINNSFIDVG